MIGYKFVLVPIADKNDQLFLLKPDKRFKKKAIHVRFKVDGGYAEGEFMLSKIVTEHQNGHKTEVVL